MRLPLGIKAELKYKEVGLKLQRGDTLVFYTDGIPEAMDSQKELYGVERLEQLVKQNGSLTAREMRERIIADVQAFTGTAEQDDDMTVVVVRVM